MGFLLGFMMGLLAAIGLFGLLAYWLCSRSNHVAVAKFINGIAQALAHKPKSLLPLVPNENAKAMAAAVEKHKEPQWRDRP